MIVKRVPKEKVEDITREIYDFLEQFKEKFV
jgi:hypothetical protein